MSERAPCDMDKELAEFLKRLMSENAWTYTQLEQKTGIKRSMLHNLVNLERGATLRLVSRMRRKLKVNLADIFPRTLGKDA